MSLLPSPKEALSLVLGEARLTEAEACPLAEASGRVLAEDLRAEEDFPAFDRAMMDGYAVRHTQAGAAVRVAGTQRAGGELLQEAAAEPIAIMTGAPVPKGYDAVVPIEETQNEGEALRLPAVIRRGQHIALLGSECEKGRLVAARGDELTPARIAVLATIGCRMPQVIRKIRILIATTGDEVSSDDGPLAAGRIRDANGPMLAAMAAQAAPCEISRLHIADTALALAEVLRAHKSEDVLVFSGGVSMGTHDLVPRALAEGGATIRFHKVAQKPGKPLLFATRHAQLIFGLPGTPLGSSLGFHRYVAPLLRACMGLLPERPLLSGTLTKEMKTRGDRFLFVPAYAALRDGTWRVQPLLGRGSSDVFTASSANAWIHAGVGPRHFQADETIAFELTRW